MPNDTILESYENLLHYAKTEHEADHDCGFCYDEFEDCVTCNWLAKAEENYEKLAAK